MTLTLETQSKFIHIKDGEGRYYMEAGGVEKEERRER